MRRPSWAEGAALALTGAVLALYAALTLHAGGDYTISGAHPTQPVVSAQPRVYLPDQLLDLNTATLDQLQLLPGVGPAKAQAILDYRESTGPFTAPEELMNVSGIGPATYEKLAPYITLSPS